MLLYIRENILFQTNFIITHLAMFYLFVYFNHHRWPSSGTECLVAMPSSEQWPLNIQFLKKAADGRWNVEVSRIASCGIMKFVTNSQYNDLSPGFTPRAVFPAISYWMVSTPDVDIGEVRAQVMGRLHDVSGRAQFKPITAQRRVTSDTVTDLSGPLYVVLKDHNSGYIRRRLEHSLGVLGDVSEAHTPSRIVVKPNSKYLAHLTNAIHKLLECSLCTDFRIAEEFDQQIDTLTTGDHKVFRQEGADDWGPQQRTTIWF